MPDIPLSLYLYGGVKQKRQTALIKPSVIQLLNKIASESSLQQIKEISMVARLIWLIDIVYWLDNHQTEGCRYCVPDAPLQSLPSILESSKSSRFGFNFCHEEQFMVQRVLALLRTKAKPNSTHDLIIPEKMIPNFIKVLYKQAPSIEFTKLSEQDYIKSYRDYVTSSQGSPKEHESQDFQEKRGLIAALLSHANPYHER